MWMLLGLVVAFALGAAALWRSSKAPAHYDCGYGMTATIHRRYAMAGFSFVGGFGILSVMDWEEYAPALLGACVLVAILYASSFLRGAVHEDE